MNNFNLMLLWYVVRKVKAEKAIKLLTDTTGVFKMDPDCGGCDGG